MCKKRRENLSCSQPFINVSRTALKIKGLVGLIGPASRIFAPFGEGAQPASLRSLGRSLHHTSLFSFGTTRNVIPSESNKKEVKILTHMINKNLFRMQRNWWLSECTADPVSRMIAAYNPLFTAHLPALHSNSPSLLKCNFTAPLASLNRSSPCPAPVPSPHRHHSYQDVLTLAFYKHWSGVMVPWAAARLDAANSQWVSDRSTRCGDSVCGHENTVAGVEEAENVVVGGQECFQPNLDLSCLGPLSALGRFSCLPFIDAQASTKHLLVTPQCSLHFHVVCSKQQTFHVLGCRLLL